MTLLSHAVSYYMMLFDTMQYDIILFYTSNDFFDDHWTHKVEVSQATLS